MGQREGRSFSLLGGERQKLVIPHSLPGAKQWSATYPSLVGKTVDGETQPITCETNKLLWLI